MIADFYRLIAFFCIIYLHIFHILQITEILNLLCILWTSRKCANLLTIPNCQRNKKFFTKKIEIYFQSQTINSAAYFRLAHHSRDYHNVLTNAHRCVVYWSWQLFWMPALFPLIVQGGVESAIFHGSFITPTRKKIDRPTSKRRVHNYITASTCEINWKARRRCFVLETFLLSGSKSLKDH